MDFLPVTLDIKKKPCLVIGGGEVAYRKVCLLLRAQANVHVVSPELCEKLARLHQKNEITYDRDQFQEHYLDGKQIVIAATDNLEVNKQAYQYANERNLQINVVDNPSLSTFIFPSIVDRSPLLIAISTGGASPTLARLIRGQIETMIPPTYGKLASLLEGFRGTVKEQIEGSHDRMRFWQKALKTTVLDKFLSGSEEEAKKHLEKALENKLQEKEGSLGEVFLVGSGPGDPELLTIKALRLIQQADVIVYDRLIPMAILDYARRDANKIYVGKKSSNHSLPQEDINQLLVDQAKKGFTVVRLKGGDPFIFGRGGEEIETLLEENISFQVVPGITAASGCSSYSGIPLTHRDYSNSCTFVTGHSKKGKDLDLNWSGLAKPHQTLVFYMGLSNAPLISEQLLAHGANPETPVALVERGTSLEQQVLTTTIAQLPTSAKESEFQTPTLIIVGDVVQLEKKLSWFGKKK
ncbi:MAG: uroporphyrin-III C-methyltransferase/precorrin-2 dehydrogenase/sirohydrochlorin ferrochelatase [bacterium]|jgi:uroporphyrin-III C-methyltransferase/precorrin-2 dehydrogenase/sirohydrochlorin ferrochelatase